MGSSPWAVMLAQPLRMRVARGESKGMAACGWDTGEAGGARAPCPLPGFPSLILGGHWAGGRGAPVP